MSINSYICKLQKKLNIPWAELADELDISYSNIMDIKRGKILNASDKVLDRLSKHENKSVEEILYDILLDDVDEEYPKISLKYICKKAVENYSYTLNPNYPNKMYNSMLKFDAYIQRKSISNTYVFIDTWNNLKKEHWFYFTKSAEYQYSNNIWAKSIKYENFYLANVLAFCAQKVSSIRDIYTGIRAYHILYTEENKDEISRAMDFYVKPPYIKFEFILVNEHENSITILDSTH